MRDWIDQREASSSAWRKKELGQNQVISTIRAGWSISLARQHSFFQTRFDPKFVSRNIGAGAINFPVIGFGMLACVAAKAIMKSEKARPVAMVIAAPVIALVFVTVCPIVAMGALAATGVKALLKA